MPLSRRPSSAPMAPHVPFQSARHFGYLHQLNPKQHLKILSHRLSFSPISPTEIRETYKTKSGSGQKSKKKKKQKDFPSNREKNQGISRVAGGRGGRTMAASSETDYVTLISNDGFSFVVQRSAATISPMVRKMLDPQSMCSSLQSSGDLPKDKGTTTVLICITS